MRMRQIFDILGKVLVGVMGLMILTLPATLATGAEGTPPTTRPCTEDVTVTEWWAEKQQSVDQVTWRHAAEGQPTEGNGPWPDEPATLTHPQLGPSATNHVYKDERRDGSLRYWRFATWSTTHTKQVEVDCPPTTTTAGPTTTDNPTTTEATSTTWQGTTTTTPATTSPPDSTTTEPPSTTSPETTTTTTPPSSTTTLPSVSTTDAPTTTVPPTETSSTTTSTTATPPTTTPPTTTSEPSSDNCPDDVGHLPEYPCDELPRTGVPLWVPMIVGVVLIGLGVVVTRMGRRG